MIPYGRQSARVVDSMTQYTDSNDVSQPVRICTCTVQMERLASGHSSIRRRHRSLLRCSPLIEAFDRNLPSAKVAEFDE